LTAATRGEASFGGGRLAASGLLVCTLLLTACRSSNTPVPPALEALVVASVVPMQPTLAAGGKPQSVGASRDGKGVQSDFIENVVLIRPKDTAQLAAFLSRYGGTIVGDDAVRQAPPEVGIVLTAVQMKPTRFKVRIDPARANVAAMKANAAAAGLGGRVEFSSDAALRTVSAVLDAKAAGFRASADHVAHPQQAFPTTLFATSERAKAGPPASNDDPFTASAYADFGTVGNASNVRLAWQFIAAHGIVKRTRVAIIDGGFYLDANGIPLGTDSDFPAPGKPMQYDIDFDDYIADGTNPGPGCGAGNPCFWHGTGSAGVATGRGNNGRGAIGTGWQVADPILLRVNGEAHERNSAIRTALLYGADVISMSFGGDCNQTCRIDDRDDNPYDDEVDGGGAAVFIASAGNGRPPDNSPPKTPSVGFDVGADNRVHPCIEVHVICVGALTSNAATIASYSNFGAQVSLFAPTNVPVMAYPPSQDGSGNALPQSVAFGVPVSPNSFGGTSASAPFVAGVVAMMKAVNPGLNHDAVGQILRETARPGAGKVSRMLDAYAAVRRAAGSSPIVPDALENNDLDSVASNLGAAPLYSRANLNIDARDRDVFKFSSPNGRRMTVSLAYPQGLGAISVDSLESLSSACGTPTLVAGSDQPLGGGGHTMVYRVPGGPLRLTLRGSDINAYNLTLGFNADTYPPDDYENNDTVATAKRLSTRRHAAPGSATAQLEDPRVTIDATLQSDIDNDWYIVQGATPTLAEKVRLGAAPSVAVYGNDSQTSLEVFRLNPDGTRGPLVSKNASAPCGATPLEVVLDEGAWFLVHVSGSAGRYTLKNSLRIDPSKIPDVVHSRVHDVIHPGDPIERVLGFPEFLVLVADPAYRGLRSANEGLHLRLVDAAGKTVTEGAAAHPGERLSLAAATAGAVYTVQVVPIATSAPARLSLSWEVAPAARTSDNLIADPGADTPPSDRPGLQQGWRAADGSVMPARLAYDGRVVDLTPQSPGPDQRGEHLFGGAAAGRSTAARQDIEIAPAWRDAIDGGRVTARLSAFLGGIGASAGVAQVELTFLDAHGKPLASLRAPTVDARQRDGRTALLPVERSEPVPPQTMAMRVVLSFGPSRSTPALADSLRLVLSEYAAK